jgi:dTDP-4-dehydrorhamnose reductase
MRILLFGKNGQVGWELQRTLVPLGEVIAIGRQEADLGNFDQLRTVVRINRPDVIVNAAAYTNVDGAEGDEELAMRINAEAPGVLAEAAKELGALFVHYSTDYVFDGKKGEPYTEADTPNPINVYGTSKLAGERAVQLSGADYLILRTAWVYSLRGENFVTKVLKWARERETLRIVDDQVSSPTWARMLAETTAAVLARGPEYVGKRKGLYHLVGEGWTSRYEWAKEIVAINYQESNLTAKKILPVSTSEFPSPAKRPPFSGLSNTFFRTSYAMQVPRWKDMLKAAMKLSQSNDNYLSIQQ